MQRGSDSERGMGDDRKNQDVLRRRVAWVITGVWLCCFPAAVLFPTFPITWAQAPMMAVVGWLFAIPMMRRDADKEKND